MTAEMDKDGAASAGERLSALADGEIDGRASELACGAWKSDAELRRTWHAWHLIGDVMRSEDLSSDAKRDRDFLVALRQRLDREPVVLAPAPLLNTAPVRSRARWMVPSAIAAGFVLVAGTFVVLGPAGRQGGSEPALARADGGGDSAARSVSLRETPAVAMPADMIVVNGRLVRDARLDRYLAAHKQFAGTSALGVPSTFLRSATVETQPR